MSDGFGSLYYTDCVPGQGLQGGAGFQFQAATPGATTAEAMGPVQRAALYEPPTAWMREQRPVSDYPRSLAHVASGDLFATAAGCYLGREANGSREGNQFTHAVVTRDGTDYGVHRPAQLWGAAWWSEKPADGRELPVLGRHPAPGPLDTETVQERLRTADDGRETLIALVSALHHLGDPEHRRGVVLVTEDPERAACWLAGATLLLPRAAALAIGFKIFVADPQRGRNDVVALHPEWAGRWRSTERGSGLAVFDLDVGRHTEVEPTEAARFWVPPFLDEDPYDIVEAVELAGQFTAGAPGAGRDDRMVAMVAAAGHALAGPEEADRAAAWLRESPQAATELVRDSVLEAVLEAGPNAGGLRALVAASSGAGGQDWGPTAGRLRIGLLGAEIDEVANAADGISALTFLRSLEPLGSRTRTPEEGAADIRAAARIGVDRIPALCTLARRHGLDLPEHWLPPASVDALARWWVTQPAPAVEPGSWPEPSGLVEEVAHVLRTKLAGGPADQEQARAAIRGRWGSVLWKGEPDLRDPLDRALAGYRWGAAPAQDRGRVLDAVLDAAVSDRVQDPGSDAWQTLFGVSTPPVADVRRLLDAVYHRGLPVHGRSPVAVGALAAIDRAGAPSPDVLQVIEILREHAVPLTGYAEEIDRQRRAVHLIEKGLTNRKLPRGATAAAAELDEVSIEILTGHADTLAAAFVAAVPAHVAALVAQCHPNTIKPVFRALERQLHTPGRRPSDTQCQAAALVFTLTGSEPATKDHATFFRILRERLAVPVRALEPEDLLRVERRLERKVVKSWQEWLQKLEPGLFGKVRGLFSGGKSSRKEG